MPTNNNSINSLFKSLLNSQGPIIEQARAEEGKKTNTNKRQCRGNFHNLDNNKNSVSAIV
jgi:hypothetical protein